MKLILSTLSFFLVLASFAQSPLTPGENAFEKKWVVNTSYDMTWYALKDTTKFEMGTVSTTLVINKDIVTVITNVSLKRTTGPWVDSTVAILKTLKPIRHSSYNMQRDMVLNFGPTITGFYFDKAKNERSVINEQPNTGYFDSNIYPALIGWLPLKEGFKKDIAIYDYNPAARIGVLKASVNDIKSDSYKTLKSGIKEVWIVTVADEISNGVSTYYIDKNDRRLWKQEISAGGRKMLLQRVE